MRLTATITMAAMVVATGAGAQTKISANRSVTVYFSGNNAVDPAIEVPARALASNMFANIGVGLRWKSGRPSRPEAGAIIVDYGGSARVRMAGRCRNEI